MGPADRSKAHYMLWRATGRAEHLSEAGRHLAFLRDHAPADFRRSLLEAVPLHAEIQAALAREDRTRLA